MECLHCGNCSQDQITYYCAARNEFVIKENNLITEKIRTSGWKKGDPRYETRRRSYRGEKGTNKVEK